MTGLRKTNFIYGVKRRGRPSKAHKRITDLYKQAKCRECSVPIVRMDFKKMLGKFTKVKIQYENKDDESIENDISKFFNSELRYRGNGTISIHESLYYQHPLIDIFKQIQNLSEIENKSEINVLQNNNSVNQIKPCTNSLYKDNKNSYKKIYGLLFNNPEVVDNSQNGEPDFKFIDLLLELKKNAVMPPEWMVEFLPKTETLQKDHLYDRIAAELEDLMSTDAPQTVPLPPLEEAKPSDEFPSIMDILNEQPVTQESEKTEYEGHKPDIDIIVSNTETTSRKNSIDPSDIEAMLADNDDAKQSEKPAIDSVSNDTKEDKLTETNEEKLSENDLLVNKDNKPVEKTEAVSLTDIPIEESVETKLDDNENETKTNDDNKSETTANDDNESKTKTNDNKRETKANEDTATVQNDLEDKSIDEKDVTEKTTGDDDDDVQMLEVSEREKIYEVDKPIDTNKEEKVNDDSVESEQSMLDKTENINKSNNESKVAEEESLQKDEISMEVEQEEENKQINNVDSINNNLNPVGALQQESNGDTKDDKPDISIDNIVNVNNNINIDTVTQIVFKKTATEKFVKCDKSLSYTIQINGKDVELLGAPKFISSIEDLQVLLQIVNDTELNSFNILH